MKKLYVFLIFLLAIIVSTSCGASSYNPADLLQDETERPILSSTSSPTTTSTLVASSTPIIPVPTATEALSLDLGSIACEGGERIIALLVNSEILEGIRTNLNQFETDLCSSNYSVIELSITAETPLEIREALIYFYEQTRQRLVGAILIGEFPKAYQYYVTEYTNPNIPTTTSEVISFQMFSDLDGEFVKSEKFVSPGGREYSYDVHAGEVDWEIWIGLLPAYKGDPDLTIGAINRYFEKNHAYRLGEYMIPYGYLEVNEHYTGDTLGDYNASLYYMSEAKNSSFSPLSASPDAYLYFNSSYAEMSVWDGYDLLTQGVASFFHGAAHGDPTHHGKLSTQWVESNPVKTVLFWSTGCNVANLNVTNNFLTSVLYSPTSSVLAALGTTNYSGGMGNNENGFYGKNISTEIDQGKSIGDAMLSHINVPLVYPWAENREGHFSLQVLLGDPSITLQPASP